ncbi:MAG: filamentous hemagglutinin N-terminal domain-containing protein [Proteobacteria bacterium]|nr:filamentous hemagglutinin N-terminal domain-containing protein [Pseudomonadota bacterium]
MHGSLKITRRRGGQVLSFVTGLIASVGASANPQGAQVVSGSAVFANPTPQTLEITNSPAAVLNWQSFDIGKGETTRFIQQNAASAVLNRVTSGNSSEILGSLVSNGHVFLINPAGILIGRDGSVDTAGVVLSTLQITDQDFLAGRFKFEGDSASGTVTNHGYIKTAPGGEVVLIAPRIENVPEAGRSRSGLIESPNGDLILAAGTAITIASLDDPDITFDVRAPDNEVVNLGKLLASGGTASILAGTIRHSGEINADTASADGTGRISLKASNRIALAEGSLVRASGGKGEDGGDITIDARNQDKNATIDALGAVRADGENGGTVIVRGNNLLVDGIVSARGGEVGGKINIRSTEATIATVNATLQTYTIEGRAGASPSTAAKSTFVSGSLRASGERGGSVAVLGDEVTLAAARMRADGDSGGGRVRVGGGFRGGEDLHAAERTIVNDTTTINASARAKGDGGDVVVWADGTTQFAGSIKARGGADGGDGGRVEVSGKNGLGFSGEVDVTARNGIEGTLLLDPKNIRFTSEELPAAPTKLLDPHPGTDNFFGDRVDYFDAFGNRVSSFNGVSDATTVVVYDPDDDFGGTNAGAVYVYRLSDGALLSELHGVNNTSASDQVGNEFLNAFAFNGRHLLRSRQWGNGAGALTVFDPVNGTSGAVDASTSLVGANAGDNIGSSSLQVLGANSVAVLSPNFNSSAGAVTIVTAGTLRGTVSSGNSLVGANPGDLLGNSITHLGGTNWAVSSANAGLGSLTVLHGGVRTTGVVSASNSVVGSTSGDAIGNGGLFQVGASNTWALTSNSWNGGVGAITWINSTATPTGAVSASNSLVGAVVGDLGNGGGQLGTLGSGRFLLFSENGGAGAVTYISASSLPTGVVDSSNSLVGSLSTDRIGHDANGGSRNFDIINGKFYIYSPTWNNSAGAVTAGDVATGLTPGVVSSSNSLVGASSGDLVGDSQIVNTGFGFGLLRSDNGGAGAVTAIDFSAPPTGTIGAGNSLIGGDSRDNVGSGGFTSLGGGTYSIQSPTWTAPGNKTDAGAVTLFNAATGTFNGTATSLAGVLDATNSLVGTETNDQIGSAGVGYAYTNTTDNIFVVSSPLWDDTPSVPDVGALTWFKLSDSLTGAVSSANSLVGSAPNDQIGNSTSIPGLFSSDFGVYQLFSSGNSSALVYSATANSGGGAVVFLNGGNAPLTGSINSGNALIGGAAGDAIGSNGIFEVGGGKFVVLSPNLDQFSSTDVGAITVGDVNGGVSGLVDSSNSLVGDTSGDAVGSRSPDFLDSGTVLFRSPNWHSNTGAVTFLDPSSGHWLNDTDFAGTLGTSNSLTGVNPGDNVGANSTLRNVAFGRYIIRSSTVSEFNGPANVGAITYFSDATGIAGQIDSSNSFVGTHAGDQVGSGGFEILANGNLVIHSPAWNSSAGAATFLDVNSGHFGGSNAGVLTGSLDQTNSLVGHSANDNLGSLGIESSNAGVGYYMVFSPDVDNTNTSATDAGAVTFGDILQGARGFVDDNSVSFVGTQTNDRVGDNANTDSTDNGNVFLINPQWHDNMGAVTFVDLVNGTGLAGDIDSTNSIVGSFSGVNGDHVGIGGVQMLTNHRVAVRSPNWSNGGSTLDAGAITWASELTGGSGVVTTGNSLVGANTGDDVGGSFINLVSGSSSLHVVRTGSFDLNKSALTFFDSAGAVPTGLMGSGNSLVGSTAGDNLGSGDTIRLVGFGANRRVVVMSPNWDNGAAVDAGAVTTFLPTAPKSGVVGNANSLVGTNTGDIIGDGFFVSLSNGNRLLVHGGWNNNRGAVTFWNMSSDLVGNVGPGNSLVGAASGEFVGSFSASEIAGSGRYLVNTPNFNSNAGALTFGSITTGVKGVVSGANSLVGANAGDHMGQNVFSFSFGNGPILMLSAHGGRGAVTYLNPANPPRGVISASNSLVGSTAGDGIGQFDEFVTGSIRAINTPGWDHGAATDAGAVSLIDLSTGTFVGTSTPIAGNISAANSLVGTFANDQVGNSGRGDSIRTVQIGEVQQGAVMSSNWNGGRGAITWFTIGEALNGEISTSNSLVGSFANDFVGSGSFPVLLFNTQTLPPALAPAFGAVFTPNWQGGRGAITWFKPGELPVGRVTAKNSLVGAFANDFVGADHDENFLNGMLELPSGNFVLTSPDYNSNAGAITFLNVSRGLPVGEINSGNSFVGAPGDRIGSRDLVSLGGDRVLIISPSAAVDGFTNAGRIDLLDGTKTQAVDTIGFGSNPSDELAVSIPAVVKFLDAGGSLTLQASNDIFIPEGITIGAKAGSLTLEAGRSIEVKGNIFTAGFLKLFANSKSGDLAQRGEGEGFVSILADSKPTSVIAGQLEVDAEDVVVQGGNAKGAYALLYGVDSAKIFAHGSGLISLKAGTGEEVPPAPSFELLASLLPGNLNEGQPITIDAPIALLLAGKTMDATSAERIELFGGGSGGAFAAIASFGEMKVEAQDITMEVGSAANTDALFLGMGGAADITFTSCVGCGDLLADPLLDGGSQTGTFLAGLFVDPTINAVLANILQSEQDGDEPSSDADDDDDDDEKEGETSVDCN